jgi:hypothetical protein
MNKTLAFAFLAAGVALLVFGYDAYTSTASSISIAVTGAPTDQAVWFVIGGLLAAITGIFGLTGDSDAHHSR